MGFSTKSLILLLGLTLAKLLATANGQGLSTVIGDKQYYIGTVQKVNWFRANQICASIGMSLAAIESETESKNLKNFLSANVNLSDPYWISANDLASYREFKWFGTGNKLSYTNWTTNEPSTTATGRCVATSQTFRWYRTTCYNQHYYICTKPIVPVCGKNNRCLHTSSFVVN